MKRFLPNGLSYTVGPNPKCFPFDFAALIKQLKHLYLHQNLQPCVLCWWAKFDIEMGHHMHNKHVSNAVGNLSTNCLLDMIS
jgi:hypothetical protein